MNLEHNILFSWIEEDNIQRAYFRVRPLLSMEGDVRAEAEKLWPNEGCLRIVPDRNEQHTFKVRMRTLGSFCIIDLTNQPAESSKIRTNKNFRPERGEVNQFILYSDTVHELPEHSFYQVIDGTPDGFADACETAITPRFYLRQEDTLYGPLRKDAPARPEPAQEAVGTLFEVPCPDGITRAILCMDDAPETAAPVEQPEENQPEPQPTLQTEAPSAEPAAENAAQPTADKPAHESRAKGVPAKEAPAREPAAQDAPAKPEPAPAQPAQTLSASDPVRDEETLPIGKALNILDQTKGFEETIQGLDKPVSKDANLLRQAPVTIQAPGKSTPLTGTPLIRTPLRTSVPQPKNRVQEVVSSQWMVGKYEPPTANLPAGANLRKVENPVEKACAALRTAWADTESREPLIDFILSLDGVRVTLDPKLCKDDGVTVMQRVLRDRLQDLEAERLTALCELDKAQRDVDAYKQELISALAGRIQRETGKLEATRAENEKHVETLRTEISALTAQRDALLARVDELQADTLPATVAKLMADACMVAPAAGIPLRLSPVSGETLTADALIERLIAACAASGIELKRNAAIAALTLMAVSPRIGIACPTPAPVATLLKNITAAFGWQSGYAHQIAAEQKPMVAARPADSTPALLTTSLPNYAPLTGVNKLLLSHSATNLTRNAAYDASQWPVYLLPAMPFVPDAAVSAPAPAISAASFAALLDSPAASDEELTAAMAPVLNAATPLSGEARKDMFRFVAACANRMEGGLPVAIDWAILLWLVPAVERNGRAAAALKAVLDEYPLSLAKLG